MNRRLLMACAALLAARGAARAMQPPDGPRGAEPVRHEDVTVNGVRLHCAVAGKGPLILFLHGFPEFWYAWRAQLDEFGRTHLAVAPDLRGYNLSEKPKEVSAYAVPTLVADVKALVDHYRGGRKVVLVGHDWGGVLAWAYAMAHPEDLDRLVILNAPHPAVFMRELAHNPAQRAASAYMNLFKSAAAETTLSAGNFALLQAGVFNTARKGAFAEADRKAYVEAWSRPGGLTGGLNYYRASGVGPREGAPDGPASTELPTARVRVPTLVIWGEKDTALLTGNLEGLDKHVDRLTVRRIPEGTHWVIHEEPREVNRLIRDFIGAG